MPPFSASTTAHTRFGFVPETVTPIRPKIVSGRPCALISFQVVPPSAERYRPLPGPPLSMLQGVRRACQRAANKILELLGSKVMSIAPVLASLYKTFSQVFPPSRVRKTPRSSLSPKGCPSAATNAMSGFFGFTIKRPMARVSPSPTDFQVLPASMDLYTPFPPTMLPRMQASPVPTYMTLGSDSATASAPIEGEAPFCLSKIGFQLSPPS